MIDSTNPRILADNIRDLTDKQIAEAAEILALYGNIEALISYSTTEADTGKKWVDDSAIYRKVLFIESLPNATTSNVDTGITNLKDIINAHGFIPQSEGVQGRILPYSNQLVLRYSGNNLVVTASADYSSYSAYIILEYTKSAAPTSLTSPAPDDTRSIEPEEREEEPIIDEPIEEPIQEVKKTTRKKSTN